MLPEDGKKHRNRACEMSDSELKIGGAKSLPFYCFSTSEVSKISSITICIIFACI
jgi:hypothetical protein